MKLLKTLLAGAALGTIVIAFRDLRQGTWLRPALAGNSGPTHPTDQAEDEDTEPVLGYDGMDRDTLMMWLRDAELDGDTLRRMRRYEAAHQARQPVLDTIRDLLAG